MEVRRPGQHVEAGMSTEEVPGFDAGERAERVKASAAIREEIAADTALLMAHAARENWGRQVGLPVLSGNCLVIHFSSGKRGIVPLPTNTDYGSHKG